MMHKLSAISGLLSGVLLALGAIGFIKDVFTGHELIALVVLLTAGAIASVILDSKGQ